jgi:hypothetical protein
VELFKLGDLSTYGAPRPGRQQALTTPEIIKKIHELIVEDSRT